MIENVFARVWEDLITRPAGPMKFRFVMQPAMAIFLAVRCGLKDCREGKRPYFWACIADRENRRELLRDGWKSISRLFIFAIVLDCAYQLFVLHWIYPFEAVVVAVVLAVFPYLLVRGPVNRIVRMRKLAAQKTTALGRS
jgi:hypothetical protein